MKITEISDVTLFLETVEACKGKVELVTGEGDRLNLKSRLCQYISLTSIFSNVERIPQLEIVAEEPEDIVRLERFLQQKA